MARMNSATLAEVRKLKQVPFLVMDNSLRESTVAALKGHTVDDKWEILKHIDDTLIEAALTQFIKEN